MKAFGNHLKRFKARNLKWEVHKLGSVHKAVQTARMGGRGKMGEGGVGPGELRGNRRRS